jgi:RHS repeat-associated protein
VIHRGGLADRSAESRIATGTSATQDGELVAQGLETIFVQTNVLNARGQVDKSTQDYASNAQARWLGNDEPQDKRVEFQLMVDGQIETAERFLETSGGSPVTRSAFAYSKDGRVTSLGHRIPGQSEEFASFANEFTPQGQIDKRKTTFRDITSGNPTLFSEDRDHDYVGFRLVSVKVNNVTVPFDGNSSMTIGLNQRLKEDAHYTYLYNKEGALATRTAKATGIIPLTEYFYDPLGRLIRVTNKTASGTPTEEIRYAYSATGERMAEQVETFGSNPQIIETWFVYDGGKEILRSDGAGEISAVNFYDPYGTLVSTEVSQLNQPTNEHWAFATPEGTVTTWLKEPTSSSAKVVHRLPDAFGKFSASTFGASSSDINLADLPQIWTGNPYDGPIGMYMVGDRAYDPSNGRFTSQDTAAFDKTNFRSYDFGGGDPVSMYSRNDPIRQQVNDPLAADYASADKEGYKGARQPIDRGWQLWVIWGVRAEVHFWR